MKRVITENGRERGSVEAPVWEQVSYFVVIKKITKNQQNRNEKYMSLITNRPEGLRKAACFLKSSRFVISENKSSTAVVS